MVKKMAILKVGTKRGWGLAWGCLGGNIQKGDCKGEGILLACAWRKTGKKLGKQPWAQTKN